MRIRSNLKIDDDEQTPEKSGQTTRQEKRLHQSCTKHHLRLLISPVQCICEIKQSFEETKIHLYNGFRKNVYFIN